MGNKNIKLLTYDEHRNARFLDEEDLDTVDSGFFLEFKMKKSDFRKIALEYGYNKEEVIEWSNTCTYDNNSNIYEVAKEQNLILAEYYL